MTVWNILGWFILMLPFVALFIFCAKSIGLKEACFLYGAVAGLFVLILIGAALVSGAIP